MSLRAFTMDECLLAVNIWTGIGAVGAFIVGVVLLDEPLNAMRLLAAAFIIAGLILMKIAST